MRFSIHFGTALLLLVGTVAPGCSQEAPPQGRPIVFRGASQTELSFSAPEGWIQEQPSSGMRKAQYRLAGQGAEAAELTVYTFPGSGGSTQANIDRWIDQFSDETGQAPKDSAIVETKTIQALKVTTLDISGTYNAGTMAPESREARPLDNYRMLAAIIETGSDPWFVKLTGPAQTVSHWSESFDDYLNSLKIEGQ